ncbi:MAG: chromosome segregation protein SMC [Pseudomonadales bacterium]|nr:chromosome segregation protein SMC [Pseudomonadales bacterium]
MRLQAIKLAGFKSFVDPTTVPFPSNLCAVVGPNGCGKSNIIDAVRWVMGESSAKNLRGESMADVIFNGATGRKPVGQASIELVFDNTDGRLAGEYAAYSEISIKRQVTRDGQSNYFLNNQKCRRKDITDIFLGTGLGPRSYSIIEQGMISQLIEARPEDLRVYIEEAAGISRYKERRRETERRISHTRDNLDRLRDLRDELERQLTHLERQARAAERYTEYKKEERELRAQLSALKWRSIAGEAKSRSDNISRLSNEQEARVADQRRLDAEIEEQRAGLVDLSDKMNEVQKRYYDHGTEIARIEDSIQYQNERSQQLSRDLQEVTQNWHKLRADLEGDKNKLEGLRRTLAETEPQRAEVQEVEQASVQALETAEREMQTWQQSWEAFNEAAGEARRRGEVEQSRIESMEKSIERLNSRIQTLREDVSRLESSTVEAEIGPLESMQETQQSQVARIESEIAELVLKIEEQRSENQNLTALLDEKRSELSGVRGRHASLEALQQAALGQQDDVEVKWLQRHGLQGSDRLGEKITVEDGWDVAVETVLGDHLQAVCVDGLDVVSELLGDFEKGAIRFFSAGSLPGGHGNAASAGAAALIDKVESSIDLSGVLGGIQVADSLGDAIARRASLTAGQSIVTRDGIWLGANWLRVSKDQDATAGVIHRQQELATLGGQIESLQSEVSALAESLDGGVNALKVAEADRESAQKRLAEQQRAHSETRAQLGAKRLQAEQVRHDLSRANQEIESSVAQLETDEAQLKASRHQLGEAMDRMEADTQRREAMLADRNTRQQALESARAKAREHRDASHQLALRIQSLNSEIASTTQAMSRLEEQQTVFEERRQSLQTAIEESEAPQQNLKKELEVQLEARLAVENELTALRQQAEAIEHRIRESETKRNGVEEQIEQVRGTLDQVRMEWQALQVRQSTIKEQLEADGADLDTVIAGLPEDASESVWDENLTRVGNRIQRLGAINLAAIDEFKVASERKQYLDAQNEDLEKALETLQNAIRKIDIETRTRFKETFDKVNSKLQQLFPKLFGGGHAYLEMTGEDLLDTGIALMARPPGKRNSSIHLLSGGEKALTAIALVFSIFNLNPAPFCMLDEVDAPLDDANVGRYSDMVKEMSRTVQFIYITHNKIAMEMADQLMGVTMHEPGVSRLVSVDVDEAVAMAAV